MVLRHPSQNTIDLLEAERGVKTRITEDAADGVMGRGVECSRLDG